jgi:peptidoglycan/LPS O-acetylase OafA/YrhL
MGSWLNWAWLQWLGVVSYSLYLLHNPMTGASANIVKRIAPAGVVGELMTLTISMMACLVAAQLSYFIIEQPSIRLSHWVKLKK